MAEAPGESAGRLTTQTAASVTDADDAVEEETRFFLNVLEWSISHTEDSDKFNEFAVQKSAMRQETRIITLDSYDAPGCGETIYRSRRSEIDGEIDDGHWMSEIGTICTSTRCSSSSSVQGCCVNVSEDPLLELCLVRSACRRQDNDDKLKSIASSLNEIAGEVQNKYFTENIAQVEKYEDFASTVSIAIGTDPSVQKVALFFKLAGDVIKTAATEQSREHVKNWTTTFYRENIAPWVANKKGLMSVIAASRD